MQNKQRIIFYIDGFNFYFGLKDKKWKQFYWLDIVKFCSSFVKSHQELIEVNYFSAVQKDKGKQERQDLFFQANIQEAKFKLHLGKYLSKKQKCNSCGVKFKVHEEKETDVRIATQMVRNVVFDKCDISILISADSDLVPAIEFIREFNPKHKIITYFPPNRFSNNLNQLSNKIVKLDSCFMQFENAVLDDEIILKINGFKIKRPDKWK
ncbi:MAG TPA: NYN domain-containing protein [Chitinophagales bacterium]|nr:NYN domain-containing protein [Chitinophagales bacterium]